jgi:HPt (histidine-containing phosphotransfer) domain-containing protein
MPVSVATATATATATAIDLDHLDRYTGGERMLNEEVLRLFDCQCSDLVAHLEAAAMGADASEWKLITHTLKGAARGIGANQLADAAAEAEKIDVTDKAGLRKAAERIAGCIGDVRAFIARFVS